MDETYNEENWKREGKKINLNIKNFDNTKNIIKNKLEEEKLKNNNDEHLITIETYLETVEKEIVPLIMKINDKTRDYSLPQEEEQRENQNLNQQEGGILIQDLKNDQETLQVRRKQLEAIYETSSKIKDITDDMAKKVEEQDIILDDIEAKVNTANENAVKAKEEITKADELSRGNRKKMLCLMLIIFLAIAGITGILLALIL